MYNYKLNATKKEHVSFSEEVTMGLKSEGRMENWVRLEGNVPERDKGMFKSMCQEHQSLFRVAKVRLSKCGEKYLVGLQLGGYCMA